MTRTKTRALANWPNNAVSVLDFGAIGDGVADDTAAIQAAVDATQGGRTPLYIPDGTYKLSRQGVFTNPFGGGDCNYAVLITDSLAIICEGTFSFSTNNGSTLANAFVFNGVDQAGFYGGRFISNDATSGEAKVLYNGVAVLLITCTNSVVDGIYAENCCGTAYAMDSKGCTIKNSVGSRTQTNPVVSTGAHFGSYGGSSTTISGCNVYGGSQDGDISCYGASRFNKVINCRLFGFKAGDTTETPVTQGQQGICIDGNNQDAMVQGNYVQGYYYGIDLKSNIDNGLIQGNTCYRNKIGISLRRGELNQSNEGGLVDGNLIIPCNGNGNTSNNSGYETIAILVQDFPQASIKNNRIAVAKNDNNILADQNWCGLRVNNSDASGTNANSGVVSIENNTFDYSQDLGGNSVSNGGPFMDINDCIDVTINNCTFNPKFNDLDNCNVKITNVASLIFSNNVLTQAVSNTGSPLPFVETDVCKNIVMTGNSFKVVYTLLSTIDAETVLLSNNYLAKGLSFAYSVVLVDGATSVCMMGNIRNTTTTTNNRILMWSNAPADPVLTLIGNTLNGTPTSPTNYYRINDVNNATGTNIVVLDNVT